MVIAERGKPVAKLVPDGQDTDEIYNFLRGKGTITGDIEDWGSLKMAGSRSRLIPV